MHVIGYFKKLISAKEKKHFLETLELYRNKKTPASAVNSILYSWIFRFENKYLMKQSFFNPFPYELIQKQESRLFCNSNIIRCKSTSITKHSQCYLLKNSEW